MSKGQVISINVSPGGIPKISQPMIRVGVEGLEGDGHNHYEKSKEHFD